MSVNQQNIPKIVNGDQVIMFTNSKQVKSINGYQDLASIHSWYREDPNKNHLGLMNLWGKQKQANYPSMYRELLSKKAVMEVNGFDGGFTYDLPIEEAKGCYTTRDMSHQSYPGIDGGSFEIVLNRQYTTGDILTYDEYRGQQVIVSGEHPVTPEGEGFRHTVKLVDNDKETHFSPSNLDKGISYFKVGHAVLGEYGTNFSHVDFIDTVPTMKCEFKLGSIRGVEAYVTGMADKINFGGAAASSQQYIKELMGQAENMGEIAIMADIKVANGKKVPDMANARIGTTMEFLVHRELEKLTAHSLMFQKAGTIKDSNGVARLNEGLWHQLRRGKLIKYGRPGGIKRSHLKEAAEYIFRQNPNKQDIDKRIKLKCGKYAYENMLEIFSEEVNFQNAGLGSKGLLGSDRVLPSSPVVGKDLMHLEYKPVRFTKVFIAGIGNIEIEEDTSLNQPGRQDRFAKGMHPRGLAHTAYSVIVWDVADSEYSNNNEFPQGSSLMENGNAGSNVFLVKPEGEHTYWGGSYGRYNSMKAGDIVSSHKQIGESYWAWNSIAVWVKDLTRFVMIELSADASKGFN